MKLDLADVRGVQLLAAWVDAERCLAAFSAPIARERPVDAWSLLPLGFDVRDTIAKLFEITPSDEIDADEAAGLHQHYHAILKRRRDNALAAWTLYSKPKDRHAH